MAKHLEISTVFSAKLPLKRFSPSCKTIIIEKNNVFKKKIYFLHSSKVKNSIHNLKRVEKTPWLSGYEPWTEQLVSTRIVLIGKVQPVTTDSITWLIVNDLKDNEHKRLINRICDDSKFSI